MNYDDGREDPEPEPPVASSSLSHKDKLRRKFADDTEAYLANGGEIKQVDGMTFKVDALPFIISSDREELEMKSEKAKASRKRGNRRSIASKKANRRLIEDV